MLNKLFQFHDMIEVSESMDCKNGKSMLMIDYRTTSKFERLNIRSGTPSNFFSFKQRAWLASKVECLSQLPYVEFGPDEINRAHFTELPINVFF